MCEYMLCSSLPFVTPIIEEAALVAASLGIFISITISTIWVSIFNLRNFEWL